MTNTFGEARHVWNKYDRLRPISSCLRWLPQRMSSVLLRGVGRPKKFRQPGAAPTDDQPGILRCSPNWAVASVAVRVHRANMDTHGVLARHSRHDRCTALRAQPKGPLPVSILTKHYRQPLCLVDRLPRVSGNARGAAVKFGLQSWCLSNRRQKSDELGHGKACRMRHRNLGCSTIHSRQRVTKSHIIHFSLPTRPRVCLRPVVCGRRRQVEQSQVVMLLFPRCLTNDRHRILCSPAAHDSRQG